MLNKARLATHGYAAAKKGLAASALTTPLARRQFGERAEQRFDLRIHLRRAARRIRYAIICLTLRAKRSGDQNAADGTVMTGGFTLTGDTLTQAAINGSQ